jgi:hypothetical protein
MQIRRLVVQLATCTQQVLDIPEAQAVPMVVSADHPLPAGANQISDQDRGTLDLG